MSPICNRTNVLKMIGGILCIIMSVVANYIDYPYYGWILAIGIFSILSIEE
jgi:hypothetical protein